ncbi:MAG TPA: toll/interleukin-1 receptor domain-containing protein [Thermoanaerobaculia bacterium]|nr:toll/interleukin-1 receptor domain-containing protein [Thermoanaerobaculia bacterium]
MPRARIFISHSAADDPALLWEVHHALEAAGFEVLMDAARLQPGAKWRDEIYTWVARAHGAVVLLSTPATTSDWVKFELAALASRRLLEKVKLVPVLVPPITDAVLREKRFDPYDLASLQAATVDSTATDAIARVIAVFQAIAKAGDTPLDRLETRLSRELPGEPDVLERTALALDPAAQNAVVDATFVACALFQAPAEKLRDALWELAQDPDVSRSRLEKILHIVTPFWIEPAAIIEIAREAASPAGPHRILLLNTNNDHIAVMYVRRAALEYPMRWALVPVTASGGDDPVGSVRGEIRDWFRRKVPTLAFASDPDIDAHIKSSRSPVLVVAPPSLKLERIAELRDLYPNCIFIGLAGGALPDAATLTTLNAIVIEPRLETAREQTIKQEYGECSVVVNDTAE